MPLFCRFWKTEIPVDESERTLAGLKSLTIGETQIEEDTLLRAEAVDGPEVSTTFASQDFVINHISIKVSATILIM